MRKNIVFFKAIIPVLSIIIFSISLVACGGGDQTNDQSAGGITPEVPTQQPSPTTAPSPTVEMPSLVLLSSPQTDSGTFQDTLNITSQFASQNELIFVQVDSLNADNFPGNPVLVVGFLPIDGINDFIVAYPFTQFVIVGDGVQPASNVTVIRSGGQNATTQGFVAGYIAAIQTDEWRVGVISSTDPEGQAQRDGFLNGVKYFCGLCLPNFPPYGYPLYEEQPLGSDISLWQAAADQLILQGVQTIYLPPGVQSDQLVNYLFSRNIYMIGSSQPPAGVEQRWFTSLQTNFTETLQNTLFAVHASGSQNTINLSIGYTFSNPNLFSQARITHVKEIVQRIDSGEIDPLGE